MIVGIVVGLCLTKTEKVDWFRVVVDLERSGYSHADIAAVVGVGKSTVQGWKDGARPKFEEGEMLIGLWATVTKNGRESVHRVERYSHRA